MKKYVIGALVGAVLVFGWQAISHLLLHYHYSAYKVVANQGTVIQSLSTMFSEEGQYLVPQIDPNATQEEMEKFAEVLNGKPWAMVTYHPAYNNDMAMASLRSFTTAFLSVLLFIFLLGKYPGNGGIIFLKSLAFAVLVFCFVFYNSNIWLQTPWAVIRPELYDLLAAWGLCGIWLGWWLTRTRFQFKERKVNFQPLE